MFLRLFISIMLFGIFLPSLVYGVEAVGESSNIIFPTELQSYDDASKSIMQRLRNRVEIDPFNLIASLIFLFAIIHTFLANKFSAISERLKKEHTMRKEQGLVHRNSVSKSGIFMHFMGEVEVVFGLWAVVLMMAITFFYDGATAVDRSYVCCSCYDLSIDSTYFKTCRALHAQCLNAVWWFFDRLVVEYFDDWSSSWVFYYRTGSHDDFSHIIGTKILHTRTKCCL